MERYHIFKLGLAILFYAAYCIRPMMVNCLKLDDSVGSTTTNETKNSIEDEYVYYQGVEGKPGVDFPVLAYIPRTSFNCKSVDSGYYADLETDCQVFHICEEGKKISFLCPNGTIFQQSELICEWWFKVNCTSSPSLYEESAEQLREENARRKANRKVQNHGAVLRMEERTSISRSFDISSSSSKKGSTNTVSEERRIHNNNHQRNNQNEDLTRASSSDFFRSRNNYRRPAPFSTSSPPPERKEVSTTSTSASFHRASTANGFQRKNSGNRHQKDQNYDYYQYDQYDENQQDSAGFRNRENPRKPTPFTKNNEQKQLNKDNSNSQGRGSTKFNSNQEFGLRNSKNQQIQDFNNRFQQQNRFNHRQPLERRNKQESDSTAFHQQNFDRTHNNDDFGTTSTHFRQQSGVDNIQQSSFDEENTRSSTNFNVENNQPRQNNFEANHNSQDFRNRDIIGHQQNGFNNEKDDQLEQKSSDGTRFQYHQQQQQQQNLITQTNKPTQHYGNFKTTSSTFQSTQENDYNLNENRAAPTQPTFNHQHQNDFQQTNNQQTGPSTENQQQILTDRSSTFQPFGTINEEFDSTPDHGEQESIRVTNSGTYREDRKLNPTTPSTTPQQEFGTNDYRKNFAYDSQGNRPIFPCEHFFKYNSQNPVFHDHGTTKTEPQKVVPLSFQNQNGELPTTTERITTSTTSVLKERKRVPVSTRFPSLNNEAAFNTDTQTTRTTITSETTNKNLNIEGKGSSTKQKSTVPLTRNDIINRKLEPSDSEEAQITQETASFYKNSFNRIDKDYKTTSPNPHPNHRETYSELKEPKYYSTKILSAISSVTPQYLTTQPINNGRPFIGSQVGTTFRKNQTATGTTTSNYVTTTALPRTTFSDQFTTTGRTFTEITTSVPPESISLQPIALSTSAPFTSSTTQNIPTSRFNADSTSTTRPKPDVSTKRIVDHATVYGKFVKSGATTPSTEKIKISLSKTLGSTGTSKKGTAIPLSIPSAQQVRISGSTKNADEILSTSNSFNSGTPQVRFFGKVQSTTAKDPGVQIHFNGNSLNTGTKNLPTGFSLSTTSPKSKGKSLSFGSTLPDTVNSFSSTPKPSSKFQSGSTLPTNFGTTISQDGFTTTTTSSTGSTSFVYFTTNSPRTFSESSRFGSTLPVGFSTTPAESVPTSTVYFSTTPQPLSLSTTPNDFNLFSTTPAVGTTTSFDTTTATPIGTTFGITTTIAPATSPSSKFSSSHRFRSSTQSSRNGFYVTKSSETSSIAGKSFIGDIKRPRPFQLPPEPEVTAKPVYSTISTFATTPKPTFPTYKISSASPFTVPSTPEPTKPTPFTTASSTLPSTFETVDSMINALAEMATNHSAESSRPGLVIPPSAGPQTLHTLAVYFANALDGIASDKDENDDDSEEEEEDNLSQNELEKKKLTELLTRMTMDRYNELFNEEKEESEESTTIASRSKSDEDLEGQHTKNTPPVPKVRQLAKVFTQALSSYLDDPVTFKKVLEEIRPTEPPEKEETTDLDNDELLNFSDADVRSSFPPFFPTPPSVRPTWGYLIAYNGTPTTEVKNSLTDENLQGADSQSLVSQLNKLNHDSTKLSQSEESTTKSSVLFPDDHWTTSPGVTKLWKTTFSINPLSINENFGGTTEATTIESTTTEATTTTASSHSEIKYELRALPQLELNSTQVHGILIDFMNTTKSEHDSRLQRILRKLNTTEEEFLAKMRAIEGNPLTRRLILLLISECGTNVTSETRTEEDSKHSVLSRETQQEGKTPESTTTETVKSSDLKYIIDPSLDEDSQDARALQLLNSLYTIASKFGK